MKYIKFQLSYHKKFLIISFRERYSVLSADKKTRTPSLKELEFRKNDINFGSTLYSEDDNSSMSAQALVKDYSYNTKWLECTSLHDQTAIKGNSSFSVMTSVCFPAVELRFSIVSFLFWNILRVLRRSSNISERLVILEYGNKKERIVFSIIWEKLNYSVRYDSMENIQKIKFFMLSSCEISRVIEKFSKLQR